MKSTRNIIIALGAIFGILFGAFVGNLLDQALDAHLDAATVSAFSVCWYCGTLLPVIGEVLRVNVGTLFGIIVGLGSGGLVGWALAGSWAGPDEKAEDVTRQESSQASKRHLTSTQNTITTQAVPARDAVLNEALMRRLEQLNTLTEPGLFDTFSAKRILTRAHDKALALASAQFASLVLLDWDRPQQAAALRAGSPIDFPQLAPIEEEVIATNLSRMVTDFQDETLAPVVVGVRSALLVPLAVDEKVIGLIGLHSDKPQAFDFESQKVLEVLAAQTAVALSNAHRFDEQIKRGEALRSRTDQLQQVLQVTRALQADHSLATNLEALAFGIQQNLGFNVVVVQALNGEKTGLNLLAAVGLPAAIHERLKTSRLSWETYTNYFISDFQIGQLYYIPRGQARELYEPFEGLEAAKTTPGIGPQQWEPGDVALLPIYGSAGEVIGLIQLDEPKDGRIPSRFTIEALALYTGPAALVIEDTHQLNQTRHKLTEASAQAQTLEALARAAYHLSDTLRPEDILNIALEQLQPVVPYDRATLYLHDVATGQFQPAASRGSAVEGAEPTPDDLDRSLFTEVVANRYAVLVPNVGQSSRFPQRAGRAGAWLGLPLLWHTEVIGILALDKRQSGFYNQTHLEAAQAFANQLAVSLENARRFTHLLSQQTKVGAGRSPDQALGQVAEQQKALEAQAAELETRRQTLETQSVELDSKTQAVAAQAVEVELRSQALIEQEAELTSQRAALAALQRVNDARQQAKAADRVATAETMDEPAVEDTPNAEVPNSAPAKTDNDQTARPGAPLNRWLIGGLVTVFILGSVALTLAATGALNRFIGGSP